MMATRGKNREGKEKLALENILKASKGDRRKERYVKAVERREAVRV